MRHYAPAAKETPQAALALYQPKPSDCATRLYDIMRHKKKMLEILAEERAKAAPDATVIDACETFLRIANVESLRLSALTRRRDVKDD